MGSSRGMHKHNQCYFNLCVNFDHWIHINTSNINTFRTLLGSVSDYCSKNVKCPTVVVKQPKNEKNLDHQS